jgi:Na+/proline symporter
MTPTLLAIIGYMVVQFAIGVWVSRRIRTESDYLLAGRRLGYTLATFSIFATWFGAETLVGSGGRAYSEGISLTSAEPFGYGLCLILMGLIFAGPLWRRRMTTLADLFRERFSITVERTAAVILIPSSILWAAAQVHAFGQVLSTSSGALDPNLAITIAAGFTILYTAFGGLLADAINDVIQGVVVVVGLFVLLGAVLLYSGPMLGPEQSDVMVQEVAPAASWLVLVEEWSIPVFGSVIATELIGRIIATRTARVAQGASIMAGAAYILVGSIPLVIAVTARSLGLQVADAEQAIPAVAREVLPTIGYALFAGALISAILSTVDSTLLVSASLLSHNLVVPVARVTNERTKVKIARAGVLCFGALAYLLALRAEGVFELVEQASAFGSAGVLVTVSFGLFTRWGGPHTALVTLLGGLAIYLWGSYSGFAYPYLASLATSLMIYLVGGLIERTGRLP